MKLGKIMKERLNSDFYFLLRSFFIFVNKIKKLIFYFLNSIVFFVPNFFFKARNFYLVILPSTSIGDLLVWATILKNFPKKYSFLAIHQNKAPFMNLGVNQKFFKKNFITSNFIDFLAASPYSNMVGRGFPLKKEGGLSKEHRHLREIILEDKFLRIKNKFSNKKNVPVVFSKEETKTFSNKYNNLIKKQYGIIISENNYSGWANAKRWGHENMQKVVDKTKNKIKWIQMGMNYDKKLKNTFLDLRGKTSLREMFFIVSKSKIIVTTEGMLNHLSSAFNVPCISINPGFLDPALTKYNNIIYFYKKIKGCPHCLDPFNPSKERKCLKAIKPEEVVEEVNKILMKRGK